MPKTEAQIRANEKYLEKFEMIRFRVKKGEKAKIIAHASSQGESINAFILFIYFDLSTLPTPNILSVSISSSLSVRTS